MKIYESRKYVTPEREVQGVLTFFQSTVERGIFIGKERLRMRLFIYKVEYN